MVRLEEDEQVQHLRGDLFYYTLLKVAHVWAVSLFMEPSSSTCLRGEQHPSYRLSEVSLSSMALDSPPFQPCNKVCR